MTTSTLQNLFYYHKSLAGLFEISTLQISTSTYQMLFLSNSAAFMNYVQMLFLHMCVCVFVCWRGEWWPGKSLHQY
jgi:hypothetical protein